MARWYERLAARIERNGGCREIKREDYDGTSDLYLKRYYISKTDLGELVLHQFFKGDAGMLHNHPGFSCGMILNEGYTEMVADSQLEAQAGQWRAIERYRGDFAWRPTGSDIRSFHKVVLRPGTEGKVWTLFWIGPRHEKWGFLERDGFRETADTLTHTLYHGWLFPTRKA